MKVVIRKFRKKDAIKAGNAVKAAIRGTLKSYYPKKVLDGFYKANNPKRFLERAANRQFFVAETGRKIIGVIALKEDDIRTFYVRPEYQRMGIGRKLFERFKKEAIKNKCKKVFVDSSTYAVPIYKALGFRRVKTIRKAIDGEQYSVVQMELKF